MKPDSALKIILNYSRADEIRGSGRRTPGLIFRLPRNLMEEGVEVPL
jgi:hypothetical protein